MTTIPDRRRAHEIASDSCVLHYKTRELTELIDALYDERERNQRAYEAALSRQLAGALAVLAEHESEGDRA